MSGRATDAGELVLVRHGQTVWHRENRYAGVSDVDLTDTGRDQALALGRWAAEARPDAVVSSSVRRAIETAEPSASTLGVALEVVADLREVDFGVAEGRTLAEVEAASPDVVAAFRADPVGGAFPGGEDPAAAAARGEQALRRVAAEHPGEVVLVVAHNTLLRLVLCSLLGLELRSYRTVLPHLDNAALTRVRLGADGPAALLALNVPLG